MTVRCFSSVSPLVGASIALLLGASAPQDVFAQLADTRTFDVRDDVQYMGVDTCARLCHGKEQPDPNNWWRVRLTESNVWKRADRHSEAHRMLTEERGQRMGRLLGKDVLVPATGCVQCHTTSVAAERHAEQFSISEGVGCEACHGAAEKWVQPHGLERHWFDETTPAERTVLGMNNVRHPIIRAEICASCHLGDSHRRRLITHEMYAAGHPLLGGFEIETYVNKMPRHWQYGYEKKGAQSPDRFERTRKLLVASVVSVRKAVELAVGDAAAPVDEGRWPELARLDCFACHHELATPSWRQARSYTGRSGRPQLLLGAAELARAATRVADETTGDRQFDEVIAMLQSPFELSVFGDAKKLLAASDSVVAWWSPLERQLSELPIDDQKAIAIAKTIAQVGAEGTHDYDTARQLFGALVIVYDELEAASVPIAREKPMVRGKTADRLMRAVQMLRGRDELMTEPLAPPGELPADGEKVLVESLVRQSLEYRATYDPILFSRRMARVAELIEPSFNQTGP